MSSSTYTLLSLHPINLVALEILITTLVIGFTTPNSSTRLGALLLVLIATWRLLSTCSTNIPNVFWGSLVAGNGITYCLLYIELALLSRWSFEAGGPAASPNISVSHLRKTEFHDTFWARFQFSFNAVLSQRRVGTAHQVKNVPMFQKADPTYVPTKSQFLVRNLLSMMICYLIVDASSLAANPEMNDVFFTSAKVPLFSRIDQVTIEELGIRTISCITVAINVCSILEFGYSLLACLCIISGLSEVKDWRPPFGSLADFYTLRRFWGNLWHQMFRQTFSSPARFIVEDILRIPRNTKVTRYSKMLLTFAISGVFHKLIDMAGGMTAQESGSLQFFCTQALGIMAEDLIQAIYYSAVQSKGLRKSPSPFWSRQLGRTWLFLFLAWSSPVVIFPTIRRNRGEAKDEVLPFSVLGLFLRG